MHSEQIQNLIKDWHLWPNICSEKPTDKHFTGLVNGLTNSNLLLSYQSENTINDKYVIRLNAQNAQSLFLNRTAEWHIHQSIAQYNICTPFSYRDPKDRYWIRPYIEGKTLHEVLTTTPNKMDDSLLKVIAIKLKLTHDIPSSKSWPKIIFKQRTNHYWKQIFKRIDKQPTKTNNAIKNDLEALKNKLDEELKSPGYSLRLCHMDPNPNNWILDGKNAYLIDWEYAALGNSAWDLAMLCDSFQLSKTQQNDFLKHYGSSQIKRKQLDFAHQQMSYLSLLWYCVQGISNPQNLLDGLVEMQAASLVTRHEQD